MTSHIKRPAKVGRLMTAWTALWIVASLTVSSGLYLAQSNQSSELRSGMQIQSQLLTGGSHETN